MRAFACPPAPHERSKRALHDCASGEQVGDGEAKRHGPLIAVAVQPHETRACLRKQVLSWQVRPWTIVAITGDGCVDDAGVDCLRGRVVETEAADYAGTEILDKDVRLTDQRFNCCDIGRILEVGGEAELASIDRVKERGIPAYLGIGEIEAPA